MEETVKSLAEKYGLTDWQAELVVLLREDNFPEEIIRRYLANMSERKQSIEQDADIRNGAT